MVLIDIGSNKYHNRYLPSAAEVTAVDYGLKLTFPEERLLHMLAKNNGYLVRDKDGELVGDNQHGGYLKGYPYSIVWILRELYKLGYDPLEVIHQTSHVINTWLDVEERKVEVYHRDFPPYGPVAEAIEETKKGNFAPFTVSRYIRDLFQTDVVAAKIEEMADYWITGWYTAKERIREAAEKFKTMPKPTFFTKSRICCLLLDTSCPYLAREAVNHYKIVVIHNPKTGHVLIKSRKMDLSQLGSWLKSLEPDRWFYDWLLGAVMNGSLTYPEEQPTTLPRDEITGAICRLAP